MKLTVKDQFYKILERFSFIRGCNVLPSVFLGPVVPRHLIISQLISSPPPLSSVDVCDNLPKQLRQV